MEDLERLLAARTDNEPRAVDKIPDRPVKKLQADKNIDIVQFVSLIHAIVEKTLKKQYGAEFVLDEGMSPIVNPDEDLTKPRITYQVIERVPKGELKPRLRQENLIEQSGDSRSNRFVNVYGQRFKCLIQFDVFSSEYTTADAVMCAFEDLMFSYAHYFKQNGVAEMYFQKQFTDRTYDVLRQKTSVRSLQYCVEVEKLTQVFEGEITEIEIH